MKKPTMISALLLCALMAQGLLAQTTPVAATPPSEKAAPTHASPFPDDYDEIEPASWRLIKLSMDLSHGGRCDITLLRPLPWIAFSGAKVDGTVDLVMPEMGISGEAKVLAIEPCPKIEAPSKPGTRPVIGKFVTTNAKVIELSIEGLDEPIGTTASHPFWSLDRNGWIAAGDLKPGEKLRTLDGEATVAGVKARPATETVYNLEVHKDHTFFVSDAKLWVHNNCVPHLPSLKFSDGALRGMSRGGRHIPRSVVESVLDNGSRVPDPQGVASTFKYVDEVWLNGSNRHIEVLWNADENAIWHVLMK